MARNTISNNDEPKNKMYMPVSHAIIIGVLLLCIAPAADYYKTWQERMERKKAEDIEQIAQGAAKSISGESEKRTDNLQKQIESLQAEISNIANKPTAASNPQTDAKTEAKIKDLQDRMLLFEKALSALNQRLLQIAEGQQVPSN